MANKSQFFQSIMTSKNKILYLELATVHWRTRRKDSQLQNVPDKLAETKKCEKNLGRSLRNRCGLRDADRRGLHSDLVRRIRQNA